MADDLVYSSDPKAGASKKGNKSGQKAGYQQGAGPTRMRLESKGRGGKQVTVLFDLPFGEAEAKRLMKDLQTLLGCGATLKNSTIELRGDLRDKVEGYFSKKDLKIIRAGG